MTGFNSRCDQLQTAIATETTSGQQRQHALFSRSELFKPATMRMLIACVLLSIGAHIDSGKAIKCYECKQLASLTTDACGDPFHAIGNVSTCTGVACVKVLRKIKDLIAVTRECLPVNKTEDSCKSVNTLSMEEEICVCFTDLCNGATHQHVTVTSVAALAGFAAAVAAILF
ncbi:hypothetical protein LSAT2_011539 [Lamellibrachia satsuma]|nr:hypothetical protein LSAT2_011539 [Lamellibrachia satsuma]